MLVFGQRRPYLFLGGYKYWVMTDVDNINLDEDADVLNRLPCRMAKALWVVCLTGGGPWPFNGRRQ